MEYHFEIKDLVPIGVTLVIVTIVLAFGLDIVGGIKDTIGEDDCAGYWNPTSDVCQVSAANTTVLSTNGFAVNATQDGIEGLTEIPTQLPLIATIVVAAVIIGILLMYFRV